MVTKSLLVGEQGGTFSVELSLLALKNRQKNIRKARYFCRTIVCFIFLCGEWFSFYQRDFMVSGLLFRLAKE